jgi:hypothetical protein
VKYATKRNRKWEFEIVDSINGVGYPDRNGIAVDEDGDVYLSYYDSARGLLKVAHRNTDQKWVVEVVDQGFVGFNSSLQISRGDVWVTYSGESGQQLKVARRALKQVDNPAKTVEGR